MNQSVYMSIYKYWIWIGVPLMLAAAFALWMLITGVMATVKKAHLFKVPLLERQEVRFDESGRVILSMEGPRFSTRFGRLNFELRELSGEVVESSPALFRATTSGISTARMELLKFDIPRPGPYVLIMTGLGPPQERDAKHAVVFMRPHLGKSVAYVLGIVLASGVFITSLVFFLGRLFEKEPGA